MRRKQGHPLGPGRMCGGRATAFTFPVRIIHLQCWCMQARRLCADSKSVVCGLTGAVAVGVLLWVTGMLGDGDSGSGGGKSARRDAFNASEGSVWGGERPVV